MAASPRIVDPGLVITAPDEVGPALDAALASLAGRLPAGDALVALIGIDAIERRSMGAMDDIAADDAKLRQLSGGRAPSWLPDGRRVVSLDVGDGRRALAVIGAGAEADRAGEVVEASLLTIARAALLERDRRRSRELTRLVATAKRVSTSLEHETVLSAIIQDATTLLRATSGDMLFWDRDRQMLRVVAVSNFPPEMLGYELRFGEGLSSQAIMARRTLQVDDYSTYAHRARELDQYRFGSVLCAPLLFRGVAIGAINVHTSDTVRRFDPADADLLQAFAGLAAIAIDHARRYENEVRLGQELAETNRDLVRSLSLQRRLNEQVLLGGGPAAVAAELARVLERPIVIADHLSRPIAGASPDGGSEWKDLARPVPVGGRSTGRRGRSGTGASTQPSIATAEEAAISIPIRVGSELVGHLTMGADGVPGPVDRALVEIASTGVALEFAKIRAALDVEQRIRGDVVQDLLTGDFSSDEAISARAARLGYDLTELRDLLVLEADLPDESDEALVQRERRLVGHLGEYLEREAPGSAVAAMGRSIVILAATRSLPAGRSLETLAEGLRRVAAEGGDGASVTIAVGDPCDRPADFAPSYRLARESLDVMAKLGRRGCVIGAQELGPYRLLIKATAPDELRDFARRTLKPLLDHDEKASADLVETLRIYLAEGQVQRRAAARLFVHVNTIVYRLHRIEELLGRRLADPREVFELTLALRILDLSEPKP